MAFGGERSDTLDLGAARVRVPEDHKIGNLEIPADRRIFWISFGREDADPQRHFIVTGLERLDRNAWTRFAAAKAGGGDALVFVHGFNTTFEEALLRNAQIVWDLQYKGASVMFSWPSQGGTLAYAYDQNSALGARERFIELLALLKRDAGIQRVHVLAHSMGNLLVLDALANHAKTADPMKIAELIMAAPDIDQAHYRQIGGDLAKVAAGLTLYASSADKAMIVSRSLAMAPRAGDVFGGRPVLVPGVEAIDVTAIGDEMFGLNHNTFAATRALIDDIGLIIGSGLRPPQTRLRQIRMMPEGADAPLFWRYAP